MSPDAIAEAAAAVDAGAGDVDDAHQVRGDDDELEDVDELPDVDSGSTSLQGRLLAPLEGSIKEDHVGELWDTERGGLNRLVLVAEETAGLSDGLPRIAHAVLGAAEWYATHADQLALGSRSTDEDDGDELTVSESELME